jgi:hypothetical protein
MVGWRKRKNEGKKENKRGPKIVPLEDEVKKAKNENIRERKRKSRGKEKDLEEIKRGPKIVPLADTVKEAKKENVRERKRKSRAKKENLVLQVRVGTQPPQIKEEPVSVWLDDDNGNVVLMSNFLVGPS